MSSETATCSQEEHDACGCTDWNRYLTPAKPEELNTLYAEVTGPERKPALSRWQRFVFWLMK